MRSVFVTAFILIAPPSFADEQDDAATYAEIMRAETRWCHLNGAIGKTELARCYADLEGIASEDAAKFCSIIGFNGESLSLCIDNTVER